MSQFLGHLSAVVAGAFCMFGPQTCQTGAIALLCLCAAYIFLTIATVAELEPRKPKEED